MTPEPTAPDERSDELTGVVVTYRFPVHVEVHAASPRVDLAALRDDALEALADGVRATRQT